MTQAFRSIGWAVTIVLLIVAGASYIFYPVVSDLSENRVLGRSDVWRFSGPYAYYLDHSIHYDNDFPTWNSLIMGGMPFSASALSMAVYPPNLLRSIVTTWPTPYRTHMSYALMVFAHVVIAGVGTFLLARSLGLSRGASVVSAIVFSLSAPFVVRSTVHTFLTTMAAWPPLILWAEHKALVATNWPARSRYTLLAAFLLGICLLAGFAQLALYIGVLTSAFWILWRVVIDTPGKNIRWFAQTGLRDALLVMLMYVISLGVASALFVPSAELTGFSGRATGLDQEIRLTSATFERTPWQLIQFLVVYGGGGDWREITASGAIAVILTIAAFIGLRTRLALVMLALFYLMLDCALGPPFPVARIVEAIAPFELGPSPRAAILLCLPLAILAGLGADAFAHAARGKTEAVCRGMWVGLSAGIIYSVWTTFSQPYHLEPGNAIIIAPLVAVGVGAGSFLIPLRSGAPWIFAALLLVEIGAWSHAIIPKVYRESEIFPGNIDAMKYSASDSLDNSRGMARVANMNMYDLTPTLNGYDPLHLRNVRRVWCGLGRENEYSREVSRDALTENTRGNLLGKRLFWLSRQYVDGPLPEKDRYYPVATTAYLQNVPEIPVPRIDAGLVPPLPIDPAGSVQLKMDAGMIAKQVKGYPSSNSRYTSVYFHFPAMEKPPFHSTLWLDIDFSSYAQGGVPIAERAPDNSPLRRSYLYSFEIYENQQTAQRIPFVLPDYDRFTMGINARTERDSLEMTLESVVLEYDRLDEDSLIRIVSRTADSIEVELRDLPEYRVLTYLDAMYPGWQATIDGEPTPIYSSAEAFKAVVVPPGTHRVRFEFHNRAFAVGAFVSLLSTFLVLGSILALFIIERRRPVDTSVAVDGA